LIRLRAYSTLAVAVITAAALMGPAQVGISGSPLRGGFELTAVIPAPGSVIVIEAGPV
jgi:hypothetical protein